MTQRAVLLANLGSPDQPDIPSLRRYLNQFLMDPYVIQLPWALRRLIVSLLVLPKRPQASAHAYQSIWMEEGSPLIVLSQRLLEALREHTHIPVAMGMRYGNPSIESQLRVLAEQEGVEEILFLPLYPHYADSTIATSVAEAQRVTKQFKLNVRLITRPPFYQDQDYIEALVNSAQPWLQDSQGFDHLLFSYHGLPESHIKKADPTGEHCLQKENCCALPSPAHATCYRHQVLRTTERFVELTGLRPQQYSVAFQSRLGRAKWLDPSTEETLRELAGQGVKKLLVICPAFVTDCLETLEEIEIQGRNTFRAAGGESLQLIPCLNDHPQWVEVVSRWCAQDFNSSAL